MTYVTGSGMQLIYKNVLGSAVASVTISSIPQNFNHLKLMIVAQNDTSLNDAQLTVNSVATGYDYQTLYTNQVAITAVNTLNSTYFNIGPTPTNGNGSPAMIIVEMPLYTLTTLNKTFHASESLAAQVAANAYIQWHCGGNRATTAITTIKVQPGAGNWTTGSSFYLYGII